FSLPARAQLALLAVPAEGTQDRALDAAGAPVTAAAAVQELPAQSERDLARLYGAAFARAVFAAEPGRWTAPVAATGGRYRILVRAQEPARLPPLDEVRNQVRELVRRERAATAVRRSLDEMRAGYVVSPVAAPADSPG
ncbi:peptidyl-prolyl cis-trans isomerase, partial [Candidatus Binatia bacterium]|nr:peptidyl-prolyl cis-trans isomerase [Candidatus Binatia bacterium]